MKPNGDDFCILEKDTIITIARGKASDWAKKRGWQVVNSSAGNVTAAMKNARNYVRLHPGTTFSTQGVFFFREMEAELNAT